MRMDRPRHPLHVNRSLHAEDRGRAPKWKTGHQKILRRRNRAQLQVVSDRRRSGKPGGYTATCPASLRKNVCQYHATQLSVPTAHTYVAAGPVQQSTAKILRRRNFVPQTRAKMAWGTRPSISAVDPAADHKCLSSPRRVRPPG